MKLDKLIYEVIEGVSAISDDRYLDERLIEHKISTARADLIKKHLAQKPGFSTQGLEQDFPFELESVSRSIYPGITIPCMILRSVEKVPDLISNKTLVNWWRVRTIDILRNTIEIIEPHRAPFIHFEFPVLYAFLDQDNHVFILAPENSQELKRAILTGVFELPEEVEDPLEDYPSKASDWAVILPDIIKAILMKPSEDPLNNSEPDYERRVQSNRKERRS